jgi:hypothetical protein
MDAPTATLLITSGLIMFLTLIAVSYKSGFIAYSIWSLTRKDQARFRINKGKTGKFLLILLGIFITDVIYGLIVMRDIRQISGILALGAFNTTVLGYGLSFWILLEEKKNKS